MDVKTCYEAMGGNYENVMHRLMKEDRVCRFLKLFLRDESFHTLEGAMAAQEWETAFRAAHTLKGVTMNLDMDRLSRSMVELTDALRGGAPAPGVEQLFDQVKQDYQLAVDSISALDS